MKKILCSALLLSGALGLRAEDGHQLWLRPHPAVPVTVVGPAHGPGPCWPPPGMRADWTPPYYHQADASGVGFDRTTAGSNAVSQYHEPLAAQFNDPATCPDEYLLWFHHLPWTFKMKSGQTLWDELARHYDHGVQQARQFQRTWDQARPYVDAERFGVVQDKLRAQSGNAVLWKDACLLYFQQFSHLPIPATVEPPMHTLEGVIANDMPPRPRGNALARP